MQNLGARGTVLLRTQCGASPFDKLRGRMTSEFICEFASISIVADGGKLDRQMGGALNYLFAMSYLD